MKNIKIIIIGMCLLTSSLKAQNSFTINGKIEAKIELAMAYLKYSNQGRKILDSAIVKNGQFVFKGEVNNPVEASLYTKPYVNGVYKDLKEADLRFYLENSIITVATKDALWKAMVTGSKSNDENQELLAIRKPYRKIADSVTKVYYSWTPEQKKDSTLIKALRIPMRAAEVGYNNVSRAFIDSHLNSFISLVVFKEIELAYDFNPDTADLKFAKFTASLRESELGKKLQAIIEKGKKTNIGATATDFTQNDITGQPVKLSDFKGQYVLVDFWASWCKPCRAENPNLLKAYNKYKDKNFTILGVSIDEQDSKKSWLRAVEEDGLPWTQTSELKGANSQAALAYGVEAIPANFLISPEGKILAKNLRGDELEKKLAELLASK